LIKYKVLPIRATKISELINIFDIVTDKKMEDMDRW